ncbi:MAG TPA: TrmH family RNA methyltransferase [Actinomycetota bacterium]|nr:TrmH family RNA methyltransferase [Actinomycetota bacterium]
MADRAAVLLIDPKYPFNVGGALRACAAFGSETLVWTGDRVHTEGVPRLPREERLRGYKDVRMRRLDVDGVAAIDPFRGDGFTPVAVEFRRNSERLPEFQHPEEALYVFGPEDGSLPGAVLAQCHRFVIIPTMHCLNLAASVNLVLYDRLAKQSG